MEVGSSFTKLAIFILIAVVSFFVWNGFQMPTYFFLQDTSTVIGKIDLVKSHRFGYEGRIQDVYYSYQVGGLRYSGSSRPKVWSTMKSKGQKIKIEYAIDDPQKSEVIAYYVRKKKPLKSFKGVSRE